MKHEEILRKILNQRASAVQLLSLSDHELVYKKDGASVSINIATSEDTVFIEIRKPLSIKPDLKYINNLNEGTKIGTHVLERGIHALEGTPYQSIYYYSLLQCVNTSNASTIEKWLHFAESASWNGYEYLQRSTESPEASDANLSRYKASLHKDIATNS